MIQNVFGAWTWKLLPADVPELSGIDQIPEHNKVQRPQSLRTQSTQQQMLPQGLPSFCHLDSITQLCLTLCDLMDCSPPGSSVHEISQARILEWVDISFSRGSS